MVVFLIRAYYTLIVYLCQEHCGANCGRIFASLKREPLEPLRWLRNGLFESLIPQPKNKKRRSTRLLLSLLWSGLRDSLGSLLCSPTRTRPTNSPPDCSLLRNGLFESLIPQPKNKKRRSTRLLLSLLWSGLRDSNSLPSPWQGDALPDELNPQLQNQLYRYLSVLSRPKFIFDKLF